MSLVNKLSELVIEEENVYFMKDYLNAMGENKSMVLFGNTKPVKDDIKVLKFKFNNSLNINGNKIPGWYLGKAGIKSIDEIINQLPFDVIEVTNDLVEESKKSSKDSGKSSKDSGKSSKSSKNTQKIIYILEKPHIGQKVTINSFTEEKEGKVIEITENGNFIDRITIMVGEESYPAYVVSGSWQIIDFCNDHEIIFKK